MKMKKWIAMIAVLAVLCTAFSGLTLINASAASYTLETDFEPSTSLQATLTGYNIYRHASHLVCFKYGFDANDTATNLAYVKEQVKSGDLPADFQTGYYEYYYTWYTGKNRTATNEWGTEVAVNQYGIVVDKVESGTGGNMEIPYNGFVLSGTTEYSDFLKQIQLGDSVYIYGDNNPDTVHVFRTSKDSDYTHPLRASDMKRTGIIDGKPYAAGETAGSHSYNNDILVRITSGSVASNNAAGYVVKHGGYGTVVPENHMVISVPDQTLHDDSTPNYGGAYAFDRYGAVGAVVSLNSTEVFFRYDAAAAVRGAFLLTGITSDALPDNRDVTQTYDYSAASMIQKAKDEFHLVDIATMESLYNQMVACANDMLARYNTLLANANNVPGNIKQEDIEAYHVTINRLYQKIYDLSFETRTVEMRATWWRPFNNTGTDVRDLSASQIDAFLRNRLVQMKNLGYNMVFVEALFNSTTIFPIPADVQHNDLAFTHNPNLVPDEMGGLNTKLTKPYDMMQAIIDICHDLEIEPHVQWTTFYVAYHRETSDSDDQFRYSIAQKIIDNPSKYPDWLNTNAYNHTEHQNGKYAYAVGGNTYHYFLNPANTEVRTFLKKNFQHLMTTYDIESVQLDYIRYQDVKGTSDLDGDGVKETDPYYYGYDNTTINGFMKSSYYKSTYGSSVSAVKTYMTTNPRNEDWVQYRADQVTQMVIDIYTTRNNVAPHIYLTSSPGPDMEEARKNLNQHVERWLNEGYIDIVFPMAYGQNIPGHIAGEMVEACGGKTATGHFVCVGTSSSYKSEEYEMRWLKEAREAGADGIASFCESALYANETGDVWTTAAITPTGDASAAAIRYLQETMTERVAKMRSLNSAISSTQQTNLTNAINNAVETIRIYGIDSDKVTTAFNAITAVSISGNAKTAVAADVTYLKKIKHNSRDNAKETAGITVDTTSNFKIGTETLKDNNSSAVFDYTASTNVLIVKQTATLSGTAPADIEIYVESGTKTVHLQNLVASSSTLKDFGDDMSAVKFRLSGTTKLASATLPTGAYVYGVGKITNASGTVLRCQGDVNGDKVLKTEDVRTLLQHNVRLTTLNQSKLNLCDANGDGKINTTDTRLFLEKTVGLID